ncbi:hypothetical protein FOMPIDRAFT_95279 [Fomitopsis schrenkii]|uniref:Uncharacterized protein n=1 Tax=Fomitopsis schrenkii TaxID=2126942 RepID=S8FGG6_FOMSC|nr:hypothetical protein FOMPIDRAFT_95279 [Fomitopsis schrenkii]
MELVARHQVNVFSNKHFAGKWDGLMAILEALEQRASGYLEETRQLIWKYVK